MTYYTSIIIIQIMAAFVMIAMISTNPIISEKMRKGFVTEFLLLMLISISEWLTIAMNGSPESFRVWHYAVKVTEFILIPLVIALGISIFSYLKKEQFLWISIVIHTIVELVGLKFGLIIYMDNENVYCRGPLYPLFVLYYSILILVLVTEMILASIKFQSGNPAILVAGLSFCAVGVGVQILNRANRTSFLTAEMAFSMSYIYVNNLILQTDKITGLLNRWSYEKRLEQINYPTCILIFDVDNFKSINDLFGHQVGDIALKMCADSIRKIFGKEGKVYRIGGDEFCVIINKNSKYADPSAEERIKSLIFRFGQEIDDIKKSDPRFTGVSIGYAFTEEGFNVHWAIEQADKVMYDNKNAKKIQD